MNSAEPRSQVSDDQQQIEQKLYESVEALLPRFKERTEETRQLRKVPQASIDELQEAGYFLALQPRRFGGYEMSPQSFFRASIKIAEACMSTAWSSGVVAVHAFQLALMDERAQKDVWGDDIHTRVSSSYAPLGKVEVVEGGFKLSGRWGWSSGSDHCTWVLLGAIIPNDGYRTFLVPMPDYRIEDTWQAMGLQGTGSNDIVVEDAFVPDYRTHRQIDGFQLTNPGYAASDAPLYRIPWAQIFARAVCSPAIGATRAAIELFKQGALGKASADPTKLAQDTATQMLIANAITEIDEIE
ncbi:MAG: acyl-CoA dehydrogenase family protein, partial [Pseudomonadales bacterium]